MALTLDPVLDIAQSGVVHNPIVELLSSNFSNDIPFNGVTFNGAATNEDFSDAICSSDGKMIAAYISDYSIVFCYTDTAKTQWYSKTVLSIAPSVCTSISVCELTDGNIGILWIEDNLEIHKMIVSQAGAIVQGNSVISLVVAPFWIDKITHTKLSDNSYMMVYSYKDDSDNYFLMKKTSDDFTTWSDPTAITLTGLLDTRRKDNPFLFMYDVDNLFLAFDYVDNIKDDGSEIVNCYYVLSSNSGDSFGVPVKMTSSVTFGESNVRPTITKKQDGSIDFSFTKKTSVLHIDDTTSGYLGDCIDFLPSDFHFDSATNKLYVKSIYVAPGTECLCGAYVINVPTWTIEKKWTTTTSPRYNQIFKDVQVYPRIHTDTGTYITCGTIDAYRHYTAMAIDTINNTIKTYQFIMDDVAYGLTKNIDTDFDDQTKYTAGIAATHFDSENNRLYIYFVDTYVYRHRFWLGYIDVTLEPDAITGKYVWNQICTNNKFQEDTLRGFNSMLVIPDMDYIILSYATTVEPFSTAGRLVVISIKSGGIIKDYNRDDFGSFPHFGTEYPVYYAGHIYASFIYTNLYGNEERKGLFDVELATNIMQYHIPTYATKDDYKLIAKKATGPGDNRIVIGTAEDGVVIYSISGSSWQKLSNDNVTGLTPDGYNCIGMVDYDPATGTIFAGAYSFVNSLWHGLIAFNIFGSFKQIKYMKGAKTTEWSFEDPELLAYGNFNENSIVCVDDNNDLWCLWTKNDGSDSRINWDKETSAFNLSDYLDRDTGLKINWSIDNPNKLSFSLSHGWLFSPNNATSVWATFLRKGNRVTLRLGENIDGIDYFQNQGTFIVTETSLERTKGTYPIISVVAEDERKIWQDGTIPATQYYSNNDPKYILEDLVTKYSSLDLEKVQIPEVNNRHGIYHQFLGESLDEMVKKVTDHFQYFPYFDVDGNFTIRYFDFENVVHTYTYENRHYITVMTDHTFSNFTNKVVVKGESIDPIEVVFDEETVGSLNGTVGWWGEKQEKQVWYSEDHEKICRDPRLETITSISEFKIFFMQCGGTEYISDVDTNEKYCVITIEGPNLVGPFIAAVAALVTTGILAKSCTVNCGWFLTLMSIELNVVLYILATMASYQYNIWARPVGHEKLSIQSSASNIAQQRALNGLIISTEITDPFCYTVEDCHRVAVFELLCLTKQNNASISIKKTAHLRDEVGDLIEIVYDEDSISNIFITEIEREFKPNSSGVFTDTIKGWGF